MATFRKKALARAAENDAVTSLRLQDVIKNDTPWYRQPHLLRLNLILTVLLVTSYLIGYDSSMLNGIQSLPYWQKDFNHPTGAALSILATSQLIGTVISIPIAPVLTDHLGRRHPVALGSACCLLGTALQTAASSTGMFIAGRICIGLGAGLVSNAASPLLIELVYPSHRAFLVAFFNTSWYLGSIVAAWSTYGTLSINSSWSWRLPSLLQGIPSVYQLAFIYIVPESPRWLVARGKILKARAILTEFHAGGEENSDIVTLQMAEIEAAIEIEKKRNTRSYLDFFATRGNRWRLAIVFLIGFMSQWAGNSLISYYLVLILDNLGIRKPSTQNLINGGLQIWNYITGVIGAAIVGRVGRRRIFLICVASMAVCFLVWTILSAIDDHQGFKNPGLGVGVVVMVFIYYMFYNMSFLPLTIAYTLEVLPFTLRAKGNTIAALTGNCAGVFNGFVNPVALEKIGWKYYLVFLVLLCVWWVIIYLLFPETKGCSLEEVAQIFDGPGAMGEVPSIMMDKRAREQQIEDA